ncbi:ABC transporter permease [Streptococcus moroccensis]|uniref:Putative hemin transport system permease protein HrtB n=1 Tax=Streptococcus moroccensis TaxID=1451356 RepID=A0ABT9YRC1_9STRE|nr:ABC transporter permease [Streptococcus moroccensis]MDQ0221853.1 putative ABC transport system permease protein [Streptococcus moroccensis]
MKHAWAEIRYNWKKYLMIELLIVLMMFMVVFLTGLAGGLAEQSSGALKELSAEGFVLSSDAKNLLADSSMSLEEADNLQSELSGRVTAFSVERSGLKKEDRAEKQDAVYFVLEEDSFLMPEVLEGNSLQAGENQVLLSEEFAEAGIELGDVLLDTKSDLTLEVVGFIERQTYTFAPLAIISQETDRQMKLAINPAAEERYQSLALEDSSQMVTTEGFTVSSKSDLIEQVPGYAAQQLTVNLISGVLLFVSAAILGIFFYILTLQKRQQFGVMRAIGLSIREIVSIQFGQGFFLAILGVGLGSALALGTMSLLPSKVPVTIDLSSALFAAGIFVGMAVFSILVSCLQIVKIDPVKIIGGGDV